MYLNCHIPFVPDLNKDNTLNIAIKPWTMSYQAFQKYVFILFLFHDESSPDMLLYIIHPCLA